MMAEHSKAASLPIDTAALLAEVQTDADGAVALFLGTVRDHNQGREVTRLEYSAYEEMAQRLGIDRQ